MLSALPGACLGTSELPKQVYRGMSASARSVQRPPQSRSVGVFISRLIVDRFRQYIETLQSHTMFQSPKILGGQSGDVHWEARHRLSISAGEAPHSPPVASHLSQSPFSSSEALRSTICNILVQIVPRVAAERPRGPKPPIFRRSTRGRTVLAAISERKRTSLARDQPTMDWTRERQVGPSGAPQLHEHDAPSRHHQGEHLRGGGPVDKSESPQTICGVSQVKIGWSSRRALARRVQFQGKLPAPRSCPIATRRLNPS